LFVKLFHCFVVGISDTATQRCYPQEKVLADGHQHTQIEAVSVSILLTTLVVTSPCFFVQMLVLYKCLIFSTVQCKSLFFH